MSEAMMTETKKLAIQNFTCRIVWGLEEPKYDVVEIKFPLRDVSNRLVQGFSKLDTYWIVISDAIGPQSQHAPEWYEHTEGIGE